MTQHVGVRILVAGAALSVAGIIGVSVTAAPAAPQVQSPDAQAVRNARAGQNRAIAAMDTAAVASYWTDDVEIRRGLGNLAVGRDAYIKLFVPDAAAIARGDELIYQRQPDTVVVSSRWPLAYESGTWSGHFGGIHGQSVIGGRYAAQWVKRGTRWLIRGEVYVALTCTGVGCKLASLP